MPYARAGASQAVPAAVNAFAAPPAYTPPSYASPSYAPPPPAYAPTGYPPPGFGIPQQYAPQQWPAKLGLVVPQAAVEVGDLPRICVVSGQPTDNMVKMRWSWAPAWSFFLGAISRYFLSDRVAGYLPIHPSVRRRQRLWVTFGIVGFFVGFVMMVGGAGSDTPVVAIAGVALMVAAVVAVVLRGQRVVVKRAAEGYLAIPKASPAFAAAFNAGRPAGQVPYSAEPAKFATRKVFIILAAILVPLVLVAAIFGAHQAQACRLSSLHPNVAAAQVDFDESRSSVAAINAQSGGQGLDASQATQLVALHTRLMSQLSTVRLNAADQRAVDTYTAVLRQYDSALLAAERLQNDAGDQALREADSLLESQGAALSDELRAVPADCQDN